ncbi:MAG: helix-turn-helix domain-containing protein [Janthinobacterium lividum]
MEDEQAKSKNISAVEGRGRADDIDHRVSKRLKMRRLLLGLSQEEVGKVADVSIQQVQKYEKATNRIACGKLYSFSKLLKVPIGYFFNQIEESDSILGNAFIEESEEYNIDKPRSEGVTEKEIISLIRAFSDIKDSQVRKKIVELVKSMS